MLEWIGLSPRAGWWIAIASAVMLVAGLTLVPVLIVRLPIDYFVRPHRFGAGWPRRLAWLRWLLAILKNLLGVACLFLGALMLVLPGQGVMTVLIGVALLDFPGKFRLQRWIVGRRGVLDALNWIRKKRGRPPLVLER